jgi:acetoin utilization deacetylase AcuC-like enzyme
MRAIGFPLSEALVEREIRIAQGTLDCARISRRTGVALNVAGGTHHAFADHGEGFCLLNDIAIAARQLLFENPEERILIVDLDVHQGNGSAAIFADEPRVFTFSMHGQHNYPFRKEISDLDIGLPDGTSGDTYLARLGQELPVLLDRVRPQQVFYLCGVDVLDTDKFGKLKLSLEDCKARDAFVLETCKSAGIPVAAAMGGGYSADIRRIVEAHCNTFRLAKDLFGL